MRFTVKHAAVTLRRPVPVWLVVVVALVAAALVGGAIWVWRDVLPVPPATTFDPAGDVDPPRLLTQTEAKDLLNAYMPVFVLAAGEHWKPLTVDRFLDDACVSRLHGKRWEMCTASGVDETKLPRGAGRRLDLPTCTISEGPECYENDAPAQYGAPVVVYTRIWRNATGTHRAIGYALQYWLFYYFDDWQNAVDRPSLWQFHEGDWEHVSVGLTRSGEPAYVAGSEHCTGRFRFWDEVDIRGKTHPVVYVARGSHANYFGIDGYPSPPKCLPSAVRAIAKRLKASDRTGAGLTLGYSGKLPIKPISLDTVPWIAFQGPWGEGEFVRWRPGHGRLRLRRGGRSPTGPAQKGRAWSNPVEHAFYGWPRDPTKK